jgi:hypothetical protein
MIFHDRRSLLKRFFALPFVTPLLGAEPAAGLGTSHSVDEATHSELFRAVRILRHLNTVQAWYRSETGFYDPLSAVAASRAMELLLSSRLAEKSGIGRSLHAELDMNGDEIVPGWTLGFSLRGDRLGYEATLLPRETQRFSGFATDNRGVIFQGKPLGARSEECNSDPYENLTAPRPIVSAPRPAPRLGERILRTVALGVPQDCGAQYTFCSPDFACYTCNCFTCSYTMWSGHSCINCGCPPCVWVCCGGPLCCGD